MYLSIWNAPVVDNIRYTFAGKCWPLYLGHRHKTNVTNESSLVYGGISREPIMSAIKIKRVGWCTEKKERKEKRKKETYQDTSVKTK